MIVQKHGVLPSYVEDAQHPRQQELVSARLVFASFARQYVQTCMYVSFVCCKLHNHDDLRRGFTCSAVMYLSSDSNKLNSSSVKAYTKFGDCLTFCGKEKLETANDNNTSFYTPDSRGIFSNCAALNTLAQFCSTLTPHI